MSALTPPSIDSSIRLTTRSDSAVRELKDRLQTARQHQIGQRIGVCIAMAFTVVAICLAASASADLIFEIATIWRAAWVMCVVAMLVTASLIGWRRWIVGYTLSETAVNAERRLSQFGQRLRTILDYEQRVPRPAAASVSLLNSLHNDTRKLAEATEWGDAVDSRPLVGSLLGASVVVVAWIAALIVVPEFRIAAARSMLIPVEYTSVVYSPQAVTIRLGESVAIKANVTGHPIRSAQLRHRQTGSDGEWVMVDLVPADADENKIDDANLAPIRLQGELTAILADLTQDTEFEVIAGPRSLPLGSIRVLQPLRLENSKARIIPPSYTARTEETVETLDLKVLEGSTVELTLEFNRAAGEAKLLRSTRFSDTSTPAAADRPKDTVATQDMAECPLILDGNMVKATLTDLRTSAVFTLSARTADGMSLDPLLISIRVQLDRKPEVKLIEPPEELIVTPTTEVEMLVEADDDLGLRKVGIMYQVNSGPMQVLNEHDADGSNGQQRLSTRMLLEEHGLTHQDAITYYAFAEDHYFGQPRRTTTPLRFIDIRPYKLEFQVVDSNGGSCKGCSVTLEELITRQRQGLTQAFQADQQPPAKQTMSRLSESQEELLDAMNEFAAGMAALGAKLPSLDDAAAQMETAIEALDALKLKDAISAEQQALAALIRARENVRKMLKQSSSQSASACRKFDREQRQKLRMPEKKKSDQQQQLAQARQKLEDLAKRERKWSQQAQQCCSSSSSSSGKSSQSKSSASKESPSQASQSPQDPNQPSNSSEKSDETSQTPSAEEVAAEQERLQAELAEIQRQLEKRNQGGQAAKEQGRQAAEAMEQGLKELKKQDGEAAAKEGERSAEQLEQLSAHLAAMNSRDFGQRLDQVQKLAEQLASRQESLEQQMRSRSESKQTQGSMKSEKQSASGSNPTAKHDAAGSESPSEKSGGRNDSTTNTDPNGPGLARDQQALAVRTSMLADLLDGLRSDASLESGGVKQKLDQAQAENPPREIAARMNQSAEDLKEGHAKSASQGATQARQRLHELSKSLGAARGEYAQPQLKELMALEERLAQLQQQVKRLQGKGDDRASIGQKWQQLESRLDKMASADKRLAQALQQLRQGPREKNASPKGVEGKPGDQNPSTDKTESSTTLGGKQPLKPGAQLRPSQFAPSDGQTTPEGFYSWLELGDSSGIRDVSKVLQTRIQEAILAGALMDADQPVPPAYKELVEKYYRALSDDLR